MDTYTYIGKNFIRPDAGIKATGRALYATDVYPSGCLLAGCLRSPSPYARIKSLDVSKARKLPGVKAVFTAGEVPSLLTGGALKDQPLLARERVLFRGEKIAVVAAEDRISLQQAIEAIQIEYEELEAVFEPLKALNFPALHPGLKSYPGAPKGELPPNVFHQWEHKQGEKPGAEGVMVFTDQFHLPSIHQGYLEAHCAVASIDAGGVLTIWSSNKAPFKLRKNLSQILNWPEAKIRIVASNVGGDFGGKGAIMDEALTALLAINTSRPVRMEMSGREELLAANPRHAMVITLTTGVLPDGTIVSREAELLVNSGAYAAAKPNAWVGGVKRVLGPYRIPYARINARHVYTNTVPCGHCRAPGDPQVFFAGESQIDIIAHALGISPVDMRLKNLLREGDLAPSGERWQGVRALEVLERAVARSGYREGRDENGTAYGLALTERQCGGGGSSAVLLLHGDGSVDVHSGSTDPGTGSGALLKMIVAEELGADPDFIRVVNGDTGCAPYDDGSGNSRTTHVAGMAVKLAAEKVKKQLYSMLAAKTACREEEIKFSSGLYCYPGCHAGKTLVETLQQLRPLQPPVVIGEAAYHKPKPPQTAFNAQVARVKVDSNTGQVKVEQFVAVQDVGTAINPAAVQGQIEGAVIQGLGYALMEELDLQGGNCFPADYRLPTILEASEVVVELLEGAAGPGPYGAKSVGELPVSGTAPAVANAVFNASGVRVKQLPITPERLYNGLRKGGKDVG